MARRRTCFSCGQVQSGSGPFCSSCGRPVDAPDLEMLSGDTSTAEGTDVAFARGGSRLRSVVVIGAVVAAIGGAAAFTGNSATSSSASTTTTSTTSTTSTTEATTTTVAPLVPKQLETLPLPGEKTGATLLLLGGSATDGSFGRSRILDVDRGILTTSENTRSSDGSQITFAPTSKGLVALPMYSNADIELWQRDGSMRPVATADRGGPLFNGPPVFAGDTMWGMEFDPTGATGQRLISFSFRTGERVVVLKEANDVSLAGVDPKGRPVVIGQDRGAYTFDPLTQTFERLTSALVGVVSPSGRVEVECTESLICTDVFRGVDRPPIPLRFPKGGQGQLTLSPDGKHAVRQGYSFGGNQVTFDVADTSTGEVIALGTFDQNVGRQSTLPAWTSDGRWLFVQLTDGLAAWREGLSAPIVMQLDGKPIEAFAVGVFPN